MATTQNQYFQSKQKPGKTMSQVFWLRIMNDIIRPRFLKVKEKQQNQCLFMDTFQKFYQCHSYQTQRLQQDTIEMEFFSRKFDTCVQEGVRALYPMKRVEDICSNKIINVIKQQTSKRRAQQKAVKQIQQNIQNVISKNDIKQQSIKQGSSNILETNDNLLKHVQNKKFVQGRKLSWQQKSSLKQMNIGQKM